MTKATIKDVLIVQIIMGRDCTPVFRITFRFNPKPKRITAHCRIFFDVNFIPASKEDLFLNIITERKRRGYVTHFSMNKEGEENLSGRIRSRLIEYARPVLNNAPDYRQIALIENLTKSNRKDK